MFCASPHLCQFLGCGLNNHRMTSMLLSSTRVSTLHHVSHAVYDKGTPCSLRSARSYARCSATRKCILRHAPLASLGSSRWQALRCRAQDDVDPKPSDPASNIQTETRNGIPPAETADLETAVQDTNPLVFLGGSWALYGMLIGVSVAFSGSIGPSIWDQLTAPWTPSAALLYLAPLLAALAVFESQAERLPAIAEIQQMLRLTLLPNLRRLSWWERSLLALSAGLGEEVFFRGFMQAGTAVRLSEVAGSWSEPASVAVTSLVFGALHSITPLYFVWATVGGVLFGAEYLAAGLAAAVVTHWVYDWIAFEVALFTAGAEVPKKEM